MGIVIDSATRISGADLAAAGVSCVMRYLSSIHGPKIITKDEADDLRAHGVSIGLVYEDTIWDMGAGLDAGIKHGEVAVYEAGIVGAPPTIGIYFASDNNVLQPWTRDTFSAACFVSHHYGYRSGWYGNPDTGRMFLNGTADLIWAVDTWGSKDLTRCHLAQRPDHPSLVIAGTQVDYDDALVPDFGQWAA